MSEVKNESPSGNVLVIQGGRDEEELTLVVRGSAAVNDVRKMLNNSANCRWETMSPDMRWMMDVLVHGKPMPSHRDPMPPQQLTSI